MSLIRQWQKPLPDVYNSFVFLLVIYGIILKNFLRKLTKMKKLMDYIKTHKYVLLVLYWPFNCLWYTVLKACVSDREVWLVESALDARIPFCEWFVIPYLLWYVYIIAVYYHAARCEKKTFLRTAALGIGSMLLPVIFCTLVPNGIPLSLRPDFETLGRSNVLTKLVEFIYANDSPPRNCMPSMHVSASLALYFALLRNEALKGKTGVKIGAGVLSVSIALATVFIKQHSVLDLFAGAGVAVFLLIVVTVAEKVLTKKEKV